VLTWDWPRWPLYTSTCCWYEIHTTLLEEPVQWPSGPKAEILL